MEAMINRWKDKLTTVQDKQKSTPMIASTLSSHPPKPQPIHENQSITNMKKSTEKIKRSMHIHQIDDKNHVQSQHVVSSKRLTTPSKSKTKFKLKDGSQLLIEKACDQIIQMFAKISTSNKGLHSQLKKILQQLCQKYVKAQQIQADSPRNMNIMQNSMLTKQSHISASSASKRQEKLYQDLQKKYFESQKEKHYLRSKIDQVMKKYENVQKQFNRYEKMQKLIENCISREEQARQQNKRLKQQLQVAEIREIQQQKTFQEEINVVRELVNEIKKNLPSING